MLLSKMTEKALLTSFNDHKEQVDKCGMPYVYPPYKIAEQMQDEYSTCLIRCTGGATHGKK